MGTPLPQVLAGVALFPYAAYLLWLATRPVVPRAAVWTPIALNIVWAIDCLFLVLLFAELEFIGLSRRSEAPMQ